MRGRERLIGCVVLAIVVVAAAWLIAVKPERGSAASLVTQIATERSTLSSEQAQLVQAAQARAAYPREVHALKVLLTAAPLSDEEPQLIRLINSMEVGHHIDWTTTNFGLGASDVPGIASLNVNFSYAATYINLQQLFANLDRLTESDGLNVATKNRLVTVNSVSIGAGVDGATTAEVSITVYQVTPGQAPTSSTGTAGTATTTAAP
jgi:Tfp pilus assembly protein PilO